VLRSDLLLLQGSYCLNKHEAMLYDISNLDQWLSTFFVLVHPLEFARKPVHPCHALKSTTANMQNSRDY